MVVSLDARRQLLISGPFGLPRLYYSVGDHRVAPELDRLRRITDAEPDDAGLAGWCTGIRDADAGTTLFTRLRRLQPFETIPASSDDAGRSAQMPVLPSRAWDRRSPADLATELRARLFSAVARITKGAHRVAVMLGGLDSSAVLSILTRLFPPTSLFAITILFEEGERDAPYAEALCRHFGVRWYPLPLSRAVPVEAFVVADAHPCLSPHAGSELGAFRLAAELGADVVVTATLGDAAFGGNLGQIGRLYARRHPIAAARLALRAQLPWHPSPLRRVRSLLVAPNIRDRMPEVVRRWRSRRQWRDRAPWVTPHFSRLLERHELSAAKPYFISTTPAAWLRELVANVDVLTVTAGLSAFAQTSGLRWRDALFDVPLLAFLAAIPIERLLDCNKFRGLLRRAMAGWMPDPVRLRAGKASMNGRKRHFRADDLRAMGEFARARQLAKRGLVDSAALRAAFEHADDISPIWRFLAAEAWLQRVA